jgi:hypothetical protein
MLKLAAPALVASLLLVTPASADGWGRPGWGGGWGGGWGPPVGWVGGGGGCCSPCGGGCGGVAFAPVVSYQPVVVVGGGGGCGPWGGGCGVGWGAPGWGGGWGYGAPGWGGWGYGAPGWRGGYGGWSGGYGRGHYTGPAYAHRDHAVHAARGSYGFGPGVRVTRVTRVDAGPRPGIVRAGFRR